MVRKNLLPKGPTWTVLTPTANGAFDSPTVPCGPTEEVYLPSKDLFENLARFFGQLAQE